MKTNNFFVFAAVLVMAVIAMSCQKEQPDPDLADQVAGTYKGTITEAALKAGIPATTDVTRADYNIVTIHTYSTVIDTTFMMELFENGDSLMVCNIGADFMMQYGHARMDQHHMMGSTSDLDWMHHMDEEHQPGDEHFGGFNMTDHTFGYTYVMDDGNSPYTLIFSGSRK